MWHCPNCGAPQAETARCWVCRRSSTTCSTCRHFRASVAGGLNYCALDARRRPLTGLELRACWAERPESLRAAARLASGKPGGRRASAAPDPGPRRGFVPVEEVHQNRPEGASVEGPAADHAPGGAAPFIALEVDGWDGRTSLFGEPEH